MGVGAVSPMLVGRGTELGALDAAFAVALFISDKTASVHVSNIFGKLGAATRTEAACRLGLPVG